MTARMSTAASRVRTIKGVPFAWADKRVLRRIREGCEDYGSATLVYLALAIAASDAGRDEFETTQAWLAQLSGLSERTIRSRLRDLERLGTITVSTPQLRTPSTYRLLPFGNGCQTTGNGCRTFGNREATSVAAIRRKVRNRKGIVRPYMTAAERTAERYRRNGQDGDAERTLELDEALRAHHV